MSPITSTCPDVTDISDTLSGTVSYRLRACGQLAGNQPIRCTSWW